MPYGGLRPPGEESAEDPCGVSRSESVWESDPDPSWDPSYIWIGYLLQDSAFFRGGLAFSSFLSGYLNCGAASVPESLGVDRGVDWGVDWGGGSSSTTGGK